jgi:tetratricopeptide (TPR) repeat protein
MGYMRREDEHEQQDSGWMTPDPNQIADAPPVSSAEADLIADSAHAVHPPDAAGWPSADTPAFIHTPDLPAEGEATTAGPFDTLDQVDPYAMPPPVSAEPAPVMDDAARQKMLGTNIPTEWLRKYGADGAQRMRVLTKKIEKFPEAPVNYVLRGELYLSAGEYEEAEADFGRAITLAEALDPELDWGYINAAYIDRAHEGLRQLS